MVRLAALERKVTEGLPRWLLQYIGEVISHAGYAPKSDADLSDCLLGDRPAESELMSTPMQTAFGFCEAAAIVTPIENRDYLENVAASLPHHFVIEPAESNALLILLLMPWTRDQGSQAVTS